MPFNMPPVHRYEYACLDLMDYHFLTWDRHYLDKVVMKGMKFRHVQDIEFSRTSDNILFLWGGSFCIWPSSVENEGHHYALCGQANFTKALFLQYLSENKIASWYTLNKIKIKCERYLRYVTVASLWDALIMVPANGISNKRGANFSISHIISASALALRKL